MVARLALMLLCFLYTGLAEAAILKHNNSLGVVQYETNPFTYKAGSVVTGFSVEDGKGLVLRMQSLGTYGLFSEDVLLCGNPLVMLNNKTNPVVLTFETVSHRSVNGVGCHELIKVNEIRQEEH
jgi:hypothetical protein